MVPSGTGSKSTGIDFPPGIVTQRIGAPQDRHLFILKTIPPQNSAVVPQDGHTANAR